MTTPTLLVVDDDEDIRTQLKWALSPEHNVVLAGSRDEALEAFKRDAPTVTLLDLGLPPRPNDPDEGLAILAQLLTIDAQAKVIILSGQSDRANALRAVGAGAYDFLPKPVDTDQLRFLLQRCVYVAELEREYRAIQGEERAVSFEGMLGASPQMQGVFTFIRKVAPTPAPVLILGESGTGKEMVAQAIHAQSSRSGGPFVPINCSAIPENLLESELFGYERGAFTGAHTQRKGLIETAGGGCLFLDEIGELPSAVQVKLLRFLQDKRFQRVGGRQEIQSDARIIAATNADLQAAVAGGSFREDLYFRLAVVVVRIPALRERGDDTVFVAKEFLRRYASEHGKRGTVFSADALSALRQHTWPGNIRELQNRVQRAVIMADAKRITAADLELAGVGDVAPPTLRGAREAVERDVIEEALRRHSGKISPAATELGISRPTLYELMEKLGITRG